jgi:sec-independent protein translocase protein TatB
VFDIAFSELVVIGLIALLVLGPKRLQEAARTAGRWTARMRRFIEDAKRDMDIEMRRDELSELRKVQQEITETKQLFEQTATDTAALAGIPEAGLSLTTPAAGTTTPDSLPAAAEKPKKKAARRAAGVPRATKAARPKHGRRTGKNR